MKNSDKTTLLSVINYAVGERFVIRKVIDDSLAVGRF